MKIHKLYFLLICLTVQFGACKKDFLDVPDKRILLRQAYVKDLTTASEFFNGVYVELAANFYAGPTVTYPELIADNIKPITGSNSLLPHYNWAQLADDRKAAFFSGERSNANGLWLSGYKIARACNFIIESIDQYRDENPIKADDIKGQAYAIRALVLHQLVSVFAQPHGFTVNASHPGIPYVKSSVYTEQVFRGTVGEVYENLINDLNQSISLMSERPMNVSMDHRFEVMNKDASKAILARVYLYKGDYNNAKQLSLEVAGKYPMMTGADYPAKLFTSLDSESLFKLTPAVVNSGYETYFSGTYYKTSKQYSATSGIGNALTTNPADTRKVWVKGNILSGGGIEYDIRKFPSSVTSGTPDADWDYFQTIVRSSEMFLIAAESFVKLGDEMNARIYLDKVRFRANPTTTTTILTGNALVEEIYLERNKELCFEGFRMFDLLRWKKGVQRTDPLTSVVMSLPYPSQKAIAPLPLLDVTQAGMSQNDGY